jgi:hypothetical protein
MKKTIVSFLSALLLCSTLASCATDGDSHKNTKNGAEIGLGAGAGVDVVAGGLVGGALGVMCSILTLGLGTCLVWLVV